MKILVCGKGGSGKSTISALLAKSIAKKGYEVLVIDGDESNFGLYKHLGIEPPKELMEYFGGKKNVIEKLLSALTEKKPINLFEKSLRIEDVPKEYLSKKDGISLLIVGKIKEFSEGCACPMGALLREFLKNLELNEREFVIVDTDAGVEHFGRSVEEGCDIILFVTDPTYESLMLLKKTEEMVGKAEKKFYLILNKVDKSSEEIMFSHVDSKKVVAAIPLKREIFEACLKGEELNLTFPELEALTEFLIESRR